MKEPVHGELTAILDSMKSDDDEVDSDDDTALARAT